MKFVDYISALGEDYSFLDKFAIREGKLLGIHFEDLTEIPFGLLKEEIPELFKVQKYEESIHKLLRTKKKAVPFWRVKKADNQKKFLFLLWVKDQMVKISEMEQTYLHNPPDPKLLAAGLRNLDPLGTINTVDLLAGGDILKWEAIRQLPYSEVFNKLLKNAIEYRINKEM